MSGNRILQLKRVVVTGMGMVSPLGNSLPVTWARLLQGHSGIRKLTGFGPDCHLWGPQPPPADFPWIGGEVQDFDFKGLLQEYKGSLEPEDLKLAKYTDRFTQYTLIAGYEALKMAGLEPGAVDPERFGAIIATGMGGVSSWEEAYSRLLAGGVKKLSPFLLPKMLPNLAAGNLAILLGARGPNTALASACAAGAQAIGAAFRILQLGEAEVMLAGGSEAALTPLGLAGFYRLGALATGFNDQPAAASRPFDRRHCGFVMAEGAGVLVLEELEHALNRGAPILAELVGFGINGDAHHITEPDPRGAIACMRRALADAGLQPQDIDYLNPHATSTPVGDRSEALAIRTLFPHPPWLSATKSATGHLLGAAGAVEAIFTVLSVAENLIPPTLNLEEVDPECGELPLVRERALAWPITYAMTNSFGFGGTNASLIFKKFTLWGL